MQLRPIRPWKRYDAGAAVLRSVLSALLVAVGFALIASAGPPLLAQEVEPSAVELAEISAHLKSELETKAGDLSFLVVLEEQLSGDDLAVGAAGVDATREIRLASSYAALTQKAIKTQAPLIDWLEARGVDYRPFYIVNMVEVIGDADLAMALRQRPEVERLIANPQVEQTHVLAAPATVESSLPSWLHTVETANAGETVQSTVLPYGLTSTGAVELWALGHTGKGIVVASQDTGVEWTHPALQPRYRGWHADDRSSQHAYNWYDAWSDGGRPLRCDADPQVPCDDHGHGTHTVGTMIGNVTEEASAVGMAPDAQWIGCRNMLNGVGTPASYIACFEFFLAPYPQGGDSMVDGEPALAPHLINNSWGCPPSEGCDAESLRQVVETVRAAGILVVASAGNDGPSCNTVNDPIAIYDAAFSVGAHGESGTIAAFSSRGTVTVDGSKRMKPDIAAPGVAVVSSTLNGGYGALRGTSMASPHVAGAAALLWSAVPELIGHVDLTEQVLIKSATPVADVQCGDSTEPTTPNNVYGYGRLNALAAVELASQPASVNLQMTDHDDLPLAGLSVSLTDALTGYRLQTETDMDGMATFASVLAGDYHLQVLDGSTTVVDTMLAAELAGAYDASYSVGQMYNYLPVIVN